VAALTEHTLASKAGSLDGCYLSASEARVLADCYATRYAARDANLILLTK